MYFQLTSHLSYSVSFFSLFESQTVLHMYFKNFKVVRTKRFERRKEP